MRNFEILFDQGDAAALEHPAYAPYGGLGFPEPPAERPWTFSNFVQSLDGIASLKGKFASGAHIARSPEDRWLMDLLRAHADALILGINTLVEETETNPRLPRGPVFRIQDPQIRDLRARLGRGREINIFVTGACTIDPSRYAVFDGGKVSAMIVTARQGAERLLAGKAHSEKHPHVRVITAGEGRWVDLQLAMRRLRQEFGIRYLLCEGGPTLYGHMARAGLIDEKFITVSPVEVGQMVPPEQETAEHERTRPPALRPTTFEAPGFTHDTAPWWTWLSCRRVGSHQFSRYRKAVVSG